MILHYDILNNICIEMIHAIYMFCLFRTLTYLMQVYSTVEQ